MRNWIAGLLIIAAFGCSSSAPKPAPEPASVPPPEPAAGSPAPLGTVRVTANGLNVRHDPATTADVIAQVKKGERLVFLTEGDGWTKVQLADGRTGWVATQHVTRDDATPTRASGRTRRGCQPDADFHFITPPKPSFAEGGAAQKHGLVSVDVYVDASGRVTSTKVVSNTTGDAALAETAVGEIRAATFAAPVRNCAARAFIYTYKRTF